MDTRQYEVKAAAFLYAETESVREVSQLMLKTRDVVEELLLSDPEYYEARSDKKRQQTARVLAFAYIRFKAYGWQLSEIIEAREANRSWREIQEEMPRGISAGTLGDLAVLHKARIGDRSREVWQSRSWHSQRARILARHGYDVDPRFAD